MLTYPKLKTWVLIAFLGSSLFHVGSRVKSSLPAMR
jgi:hypothetical protein